MHIAKCNKGSEISLSKAGKLKVAIDFTVCKNMSFPQK